MRENLHLSMLLLALLATSCAGKKFSEKVDSGTSASATIDSTEGTIDSTEVSGADASPQKAPIPGCDKTAVGITQAKLLSNGISTLLGTQTLRYELAVLSCKDGSIQSLQDQPILFDLDAALAGGFQPVTYSVLDSTGASLSNSTLQVVTGSDLFGNTGEYAHWITKNFSYSSKQEKLILEIKLENIQVQPRNVTDTTINSFLRIGNAQAVAQSLTIIN